MLNFTSTAFAKWTALLPISIVPAPSKAPSADIHIRFMSMSPSENQYAFTNMIADGLALSPGLINITFNDDYNWSDDRLFNFTAVHEIGHALGLSHSKVEDAVMFAYFVGIIRELHPDDEAAIHSVYGWKDPRWSRIDMNAATKNLIQVSSTTSTPAVVDGIYQLRSTGQVLYYSPSGSWTSVDNNKDTVQITGSNGYLYQRHADGSTYKYSGSGSDWQWIGGASDNVIDIVAASDQVYVRRKDGWIARWSGTGQQWTTIQQPSTPSSRQIAITDSKVLWVLLTNGDLVRSEWPYSPTGWQTVDINAANSAITVGGENFYKLQSDGKIVWLDTVQYFWSTIENSGSVGVYAVGEFVYSRHGDGSIWRYTGTPGVWEMLDSRGDSVSVVGDRRGRVFEMLSGGDIYKLVS
ncbi:zincin [Massarina eburnea CBS 473.64]|uniref:Zincin n=1 Tax=Massarina eburnea CBS 473.64 TaxID=1395130 RepID=A0A6A6RM04_9PLEO|nr:zincin [Massarina eburnea CBS 473.64]